MRVLTEIKKNLIPPPVRNLSDCKTHILIFAALFGVAALFVSCMNFLGDDMRASYKRAPFGAEIQRITVCEEYTEEIVIIPKGETRNIEGKTPTWDGFANGAFRRGVFVDGRNVTLTTPYTMGKYEVTQEFFKKVMGVNSSYQNATPDAGEIQELRPADNMGWYGAIAFCNKLSIMEGLEPCYSVEGVDWESLTYDEIPKTKNETWNNAKWDRTKKGYRLPTEAEWEFAARGGDPSDEVVWNYCYSGGGNVIGDTDEEPYSWCYHHTNKSHQVGLKKPNTLGMYDMSGNVWEWCWDWYEDMKSETVTDPCGPETPRAFGTSYDSSFTVKNQWAVYSDEDAVPRRIIRGGGATITSSKKCTVTCRELLPPVTVVGVQKELGIRLARSL